jgi:tetratricopeptide (TPR) repeat protein
MSPVPANDRRAAADPGATYIPDVTQRIEQIRTEQREAWKAGRRLLAEAYLFRFPDLAADDTAVLDLVVSEYRLRAELGDNPTAGEYGVRFPQHAAAIKERFAAESIAGVGSFNETILQAPGLTAPPEPTRPPDDNRPTVTAVPKPSPSRAAGSRPTMPGYDLLGELGRGAMGVVYRARQRQLGREVALKMILSGQFAGPRELERFRIEAVQLAKLQHPNIVQIYEVGEHEDRPYFAMEFVPGGSLAKQLEKQPLAARPAAALVETLARAMQHAHDRGIIHRDLKPANVMLAADGSPKVMDFGLAKGTGSVGDTASYAVLGTPSYMAPEQAGGGSRDVGPAADVYALGSILYEALTGRPPFRAATVLDTIQLVVESEPVPPSELTAHLPRDLETITLKCLQKEPTKRYASAASLAEDLHRFLDDQPILARPVSTWEKAWKWAKRRPAWAALIATVVIATAGVIGGGIWFNAKLREEKNVAVANANLAEERFQENRAAIDRYFTEVSESDLLDEPGLQPLREKLLKLAKDYYARFVAERHDDPTVRADLAKSLGRLARISADLKDPRDAIDLNLQALPIFQELAAANPDDLARRADIAATWYELSKLYRLTNQVDAAESACATAVSQWDALAKVDPGNANYSANIARSLVSQSNFYFGLGRLDHARDSCERALYIRQRLAAKDPKNEALTRDLATAWDNLANIRAQSGQRPESRAARKQAGDLFRGLVTANPFRSLYRNDLARVQFNNGMDFLRTAEPRPAADALKEAVTQWDRLHSLHPAVREYQVSLGNALFELTQAEWSSGQVNESDTTLAQARTIRAALVEQYPAVPDYATELARCDAEAGDHALRRGDPKSAAEAFGRAADRVAPLAVKFRAIPHYRADLARQRLNVGKALGQAGQYDAAKTSIKQSSDLWTGLNDDPVFGAEAEAEALDCLNALGDVDFRAGNNVAALVSFDKTVETGEPLLAKNPAVLRRLKDACRGQAEALTAQGKYPEAIAAWDHAISVSGDTKTLYLRIFRLKTLARTREYEQALLDLDSLAIQARAAGEALFHVARVYALASKSAAADMKLKPAERERRANESADRAIENLKLAQSKGYFANPASRDELAHNADLDSIRARPDFQKLLADVNSR